MESKEPQSLSGPVSSETEASAGSGSVNVKVKFFTTLREITGKKEEQCILHESSTMGDLVQSLVKTYGRELRDYLLEGDQLRSHFQILINGRAVDVSTALNTSLKDGSTIAILPPAGGGQ